jgi:hypothetical protein
MKFTQSIWIRSRMEQPEFAGGLWNPSRKEWRDIIESLIRMSRKYKDNKLVMFKLQLWILWDLVNESTAVIKMKDKIEELEKNFENKKIEKNQYDFDIQNLRTQIESSRLTISALREIIDGIVWRYFNYNRGLLCMLSDKQPVDLIDSNKGLETSLIKLAEIFSKEGDKAILNDLSNFLRIADVTNIQEDGTIEFIEVKSSKSGLRGARVTRQKEKMQEIVEFFNTGKKELDGKEFIINEVTVKQANHLNEWKDSILRARSSGWDSILIGNYLIVETVDITKIKGKSISNYFDSRHKSVKEEWKKKKDLVFNAWAIEKISYVKNYAPYTIFPLDDDLCADILMGKIWVRYQINMMEVMRILKKYGWKIVDSIFLKSDEELSNPDLNLDDMNIFVIQKEKFAISIPPTWMGRLIFEMITIKVMIEELDMYYKKNDLAFNTKMVSNNLDEQNIWN